MAILRGPDGRMYDVPDDVLQNCAVSGGDGGPGGGEGGGGPLVIVQIIGGRAQMSGPATGGGGGGVQAYSHCGHWRNCCWRNRGRCRA